MVLLLIIVSVLAVPSVRFRLSQMRNEFDFNSVGRMTMWTKVAPGLIRDHPWGIGYGQLKNETMRLYAPEVEADRSHLHSNFPQVLVETGWLGLGVYFAWMALAVGIATRRVRESWNSGPGGRIPALVLLLMLCSLLLHGVVEYNFGDTELQILLAMILGIL